MNQEPNSSTNLVNTTPQANQLPIQQATSSQGMQPSVTGDIKKEKANKRLKVYGIISLIIGCVVLVGYVLPYILFGENNLAVVYMAYNVIYRPIFWFGIIACVILFFLTLDNLAKYKIRLSIFVTMSIIGVLLAFSPLIYDGIRRITYNNDPYIAKGMASTGYGCSPFSSRAKYDTYANSNDIMCGYLEAFYKNGKEPKIQQDIISYINSSGVKNGDIRITIDGEQPKGQHHFNIVTRHSCDYYKGEDDSFISVWFYESNGDMAYKCAAIKASNGNNIYDLEQSKEWFESQFDVKISAEEAQVLIENKRKEQGDDTWTTGAVEVLGKNDDDYYWIFYEEIRSDGTKSRLETIFHYEDGAWTFDIPGSSYIDNLGKYNFSNL
ncbi:hypothetical protein IKD57_03340 [Candidatus Saccharibacteria bacterium]|nr:hypothetical protein [Candidatus Saccharibacteria bacterium]